LPIKRLIEVIRPGMEYVQYAPALHAVLVRFAVFISLPVLCSTLATCRYLETFVVESWVEHLRSHERVTVAARAASERASAFDMGDTPPIITHLSYAPEEQGDR
jgi:hypothetical protein